MNQDYIQKVIKIRGEAGKKWVETIPSLIKKYEKLWEITVSDPFNLSYNYVAPAKNKRADDVVFKICLPPANEPYYEIPALEFFNGEGCVQLLQKDVEENVLLLERAMPGEKLQDLQHTDAVDVACSVIKQLHKNITKKEIATFPTLSFWAKDFAVYRNMFSLSTGPIPKRLFEKAEEIFTQYPKENREKVLLHGDLHAENILSSQRGFLAIDPKGIIGEQEFELGIFFRSSYQDIMQDGNYKKVIADGILKSAEILGLDKKRIKDWAFATAVNGLVWFLEDQNSFRSEYLENAKLLEEIVI